MRIYYSVANSTLNTQRLHAYLKRNFRRPQLRLPTIDSPYNQRLWDSLSTHPQSMTEPLNPALTEGKVQNGKTITSQLFFV